MDTLTPSEVGSDINTIFCKGIQHSVDIATVILYSIAVLDSFIDRHLVLILAWKAVLGHAGGIDEE